MATFTGKLETVVAAAAEQGSVEIALCGYGSRVPRVNAEALYGRVTGKTSEVPVDPSGVFTGQVHGNDEIAPAGTYYTVTIKDSNGDVVQINAYRFLGAGTYDLNLIDPYDPNQPPPPLPPLITNLLLIVPPGPAPNFDGSQYTAWKITLDQDVSMGSLSGIVPGNLYTFIIVQNAAGGHKFSFPAGCKNVTEISPEPNALTIQTFVADEYALLNAIGPGTWS